MGQNLSKTGVVGTLAVVGAATFLGGCSSMVPSRDRALMQPGISATTVTTKVADASDPSKTTEAKRTVVELDAEGGYVIASSKTAYVVVNLAGQTNYYAGTVNFNGNAITAAEGTEKRVLGENPTLFTVSNVKQISKDQFAAGVQSTLANADFATLGGVFRAPVNPVINSLNGTKVILVKLPRNLDLSKPENNTALEQFMLTVPKKDEPATAKQDGKKVSMVMPDAYARVRGARA